MAEFTVLQRSGCQQCGKPCLDNETWMPGYRRSFVRGALELASISCRVVALRCYRDSYFVLTLSASRIFLPNSLPTYLPKSYMSSNDTNYNFLGSVPFRCRIAGRVRLAFLLFFPLCFLQDSLFPYAPMMKPEKPE